MALQTLFSDEEGFNLASPNNNTNSLNYFGLEVAISGAQQEVITWHHPGNDGDQKKKMGLRGKSGSISGFLEASSAANINTGYIAINAKITNAIPADATFWGSMVVEDVLITNCSWGSWVRSSTGRVSWYFTLIWEAP